MRARCRLQTAACGRVAMAVASTCVDEVTVGAKHLAASTLSAMLRALLHIPTPQTQAVSLFSRGLVFDRVETPLEARPATGCATGCESIRLGPFSHPSLPSQHVGSMGLAMADAHWPAPGGDLLVLDLDLRQEVVIVKRGHARGR